MIKYCEICEWYDTENGTKCFICGALRPERTLRNKIYYGWLKFRYIYLTKRLDKR